MEVASRPITVVIALGLICIPIIQILITSLQPVLVLIFLPSLFVLYRVWMRDNVARWFASFLITLLLSFAGYSTWQAESMRSKHIEATTNTVATMETQRLQWYQYAFLGCYAVGLALLHVPSSHRWFKEG